MWAISFGKFFLSKHPPPTKPYKVETRDFSRFKISFSDIKQVQNRGFSNKHPKRLSTLSFFCNSLNSYLKGMNPHLKGKKKVIFTHEKAMIYNRYQNDLCFHINPCQPFNNTIPKNNRQNYENCNSENSEKNPHRQTIG